MNRRTERLVHTIFHSINHSESEEIDFGYEFHEFHIVVIPQSTYDCTFDRSTSHIELPVDHDEFQEQNPLRIVFVFIRTYALESMDENVLKFAKVQKYLKV